MLLILLNISWRYNKKKTGTEITVSVSGKGIKREKKICLSPLHRLVSTRTIWLPIFGNICVNNYKFI